MSDIDVDALLAEISEDSPCGENLEYDVDFGLMERAAEGSPEQQIGDSVIPFEDPDWRQVKSLAVDLCGRTKDLRVAIFLARAALQLDGIDGFRDSLAVLHGLVERYWAEVHPQLDPDDDNDPVLRVNTVETLCDNEAVLHPLRAAPLVEVPLLGNISLRDIQLSSGEAHEGEDVSDFDRSSIEGAFLDCDLDELMSLYERVKGSLESANGIDSMITGHIGAGNAPNLEALVKMLGSIDQELFGYLNQRGAFDPPEEDSGDDEDGTVAAQRQKEPGGGGSGEITSRKDVIATIDRICEYYQRFEPSSPLPILLQRAKRLVSKSFLDIIRDLTPDALSQAESLGGIAARMESDSNTDYDNLSSDDDDDDESDGMPPGM